MQSSPPSERQPLTSTSSTQAVVATPPRSTGRARHNLISLSAAALCASFFLTWINFLGVGLSGLHIQQNFESYRLVWLMPVLAALVLMLNMARIRTGVIRRFAGLCPFATLAYGMTRLGTDLVQAIQLGGWLALIAGAVLMFIPNDGKTRA